MTFAKLQHMPLSTAYLCEDCHSVGNSAIQCPACASEALMGLAGVLQREEPKPMALRPIQIRFPRNVCA